MGQADILAWLEEHPGWHEPSSLASSLDIQEANIRRILRILKRNREIEVQRVAKGKLLYRHLAAEKKDYIRATGRPGRSVENRVGQAWRSGSVQVIGEDLFGQAKLFVLPTGHFQCRHCLTVVRIDERGFAACDNCGMIYNDGKPEIRGMSKRERKRRKDKLIYVCKHTKS